MTEGKRDTGDVVEEVTGGATRIVKGPGKKEKLTGARKVPAKCGHCRNRGFVRVDNDPLCEDAVFECRLSGAKICTTDIACMNYHDIREHIMIEWGNPDEPG